MGECEFEDGNIQAKKRVRFLKRVLDNLGINGDRLNIYECGAAEVNKFLEAINDTYQKLESLGRSPLTQIT
ncbi:MAG: hydrogenase iron-sulfur subunit [Candidatus Lokiarchaeota archaeon]|nr:hydrogenase iron-sulfur subunit [Candidatus Lokiarchaeota archaeon]